MDLSKFTDEELAQIAGIANASPPEMPGDYSDAELGQIAGSTRWGGNNKGRAQSVAQGFNSAVPFGNRITAGMAALATAPFTEASVSDLYAQARADQEATETAHPDYHLAGTLGGIGATLPIGFSKAVATTPGLGTVANAAANTSTKVGNLIRGADNSGRVGQALRGAALAAPTTAVYGYGDAPEGERLPAATTGFGMGFVGGTAAPYIASAISATPRLFNAAANRIGAIAGFEGAQNNVALNIIAKRLIDDGYSPEAVNEALSKANASGLRPTLGEATNSSSVLQAEKNIVRSTGEGANTMRNFLNQRNRDTIPRTLGNFADKLEAQAGDLNAAYKAAADEAAAKAATRTDNYAPESTAVRNIQNQVQSRLGGLGKVKNVESNTLGSVNRILNQALKEGGDFNALLKARQQLDNIYIDNADSTIQKQAQRYVGSYRKQIDSVLEGLAPSVKKADRLAQSKMAASEIRDALADTNQGSLGVLYNKIWAKPELRDDFLRKLPDDATREEATNLFNQLENVKRGFGGSDTAFNIPSGQQLANEAGIGFDVNALNPFQAAPSLVQRVGSAAQPGVYKKIADQATNPNSAEITKALSKRMGISQKKLSQMSRAELETEFQKRKRK